MQRVHERLVLLEVEGKFAINKDPSPIEKRARSDKMFKFNVTQLENDLEPSWQFFPEIFRQMAFLPFELNIKGS